MRIMKLLDNYGKELKEGDIILIKDRYGDKEVQIDKIYWHKKGIGIRVLSDSLSYYFNIKKYDIEKLDLIV